LELEAFNRLEKWLRWDEYTERLQKDRLSDLKDDAIRYSNGSTHPSYRGAFQALLALLEQTPQQSSLLYQGVPAMSASEFGCKRSFHIVRADGTLVSPPEPLVGDSPDDPASLASRSFGGLWVEVATDVKAGQPIARERVVKLQQALTEWKAAAQGTMGRAPQSRQSAARAHLNTAEALICCLNDDERTEKLSQFLRVGDAGFPGGTVGDLVRHILDNQLSVPYGSRPQLVLANLTHDITHENVGCDGASNRWLIVKVVNQPDQLVVLPDADHGDWRAGPIHSAGHVNSDDFRIVQAYFITSPFVCCSRLGLLQPGPRYTALFGPVAEAKQIVGTADIHRISVRHRHGDRQRTGVVISAAALEN
jgi:hypothetical protein